MEQLRQQILAMDAVEREKFLGSLINQEDFYNGFLESYYHVGYVEQLIKDKKFKKRQFWPWLSCFDEKFGYVDEELANKAREAGYQVIPVTVEATIESDSANSRLEHQDLFDQFMEPGWETEDGNKVDWFEMAYSISYIDALMHGNGDIEECLEPVEMEIEGYILV